MPSGVQASVVAALTLAAVSTLGDFIWASGIPPHGPLSGLIHGAILFLCVGFLLGMKSRRPAAGAVSAMLIGALAAGGFYLLRPLTGYYIMFVLWIGVWVALGIVHERLRAGRACLATSLARGALAAVSSGAAFYLISGIWRPFDPQGWDYLKHFAAWTLPFFCGFASLLVRRDAGGS
jgi:hypothetical protein